MDRPPRSSLETIYTPDSDLLSFARLWSAMWRDLLAARELAWRLLVRNLSAQFRQSYLGYAWAFLPPLFTTAIWVFLSSQNILNVGDTGMPYTVYVLVGTVLWQTFVEALNGPLQTVNESRSMLIRINFPREALFMTAIGLALFNFAIRVLILIPLFWWFGIAPQAGMFLAILGVLSLILLGASIGLALTPLGMLYQDVGRVITIGTQALFFLTPIIYPTPKATFAATLIQFNPVTPLLQQTRAWLISGQGEYFSSFLLVTGLSLLLFLIAWVVYRVSMPHLISRMSA